MIKQTFFLYFCVIFFLMITYPTIMFTFKNDTSNIEKKLNLLIKNIKEITKVWEKIKEVHVQRLLVNKQSENNERIQRVEDACRKYNLGLLKNRAEKILEYPPVPHYSVFYFDRVNKFSLCPIYKAGSTTWLFNLCILAGMTENEIENSKMQLSTLARLKYPELEPMVAEKVSELLALRESLKIITVRHPFERLLSAYRDKLENINIGREHGTMHFYTAFGRKIVKRYRKNGKDTKMWDILKPSQYHWNEGQPKPEGIEPTFREFILYLINTNLVQHSDDHWIPYYLFCTPCLVRYDIIAKVETMTSDQVYVTQVLQLQDKIQPRWKHKTQFLSETKSDNVSPLAKIYFSQLTMEEVNNLYNKYQVDFDMFGYNYSDYLKYTSDYSKQINENY